jgi:D-glycero-D-manno-heptose 1,7-bisphosphate phosphatase
LNNKDWTLFLDRDGVINYKIDNDYVQRWEDFKFIEGSLDALCGLRIIFSRIIIVTNQRGVGKGLMSITQLREIHDKMLRRIEECSGRIDKVYYCTEIFADATCRKPNTGMAILAQIEFPKIDFTRSIMVGDSISDMEFGKRLGMKTVFIGPNYIISNEFIDLVEGSLYDFYLGLRNDRYKNLLS